MMGSNQTGDIRFQAGVFRTAAVRYRTFLFQI